MWSSGVHTWDGFLEKDTIRLSRTKIKQVTDYVKQSIIHLNNHNPNYFAALLPSKQQRRLFPDFRRSTAYLDIETTGLGGPDDYITTIALYDGKTVSYYVKGNNLDDFEKDIKKFKVIVTYNGKCFDVPFIKDYLNIQMDHAHIDLRYILKGLGYSGGLNVILYRYDNKLTLD